jgi:hypothetical protein
MFTESNFLLSSSGDISRSIPISIVTHHINAAPPRDSSTVSDAAIVFSRRRYPTYWPPVDIGAINSFKHDEGILPTQIDRRLAAQGGLDTYSLRSVQHWCQFFNCGAKTYMMTRGPEDRCFFISTPKLSYAWRGNRSLRRTRWPRPWTCRPQPS